MKKKIVSFLTIICMVITLIPATVATSHAATTPPSVSKSTVLDRIEELETGLSGKFFTTTGYPANHSGDAACDVVNVLNQNTTVRNLIYNNKGKTGYRPDYNSYIPKHYCHYAGSLLSLGQSCCGFANFAEWYIFSSKCSDSVSTKTIAKGIAFTYSNMSSYAKVGDVIRITGYSGDKYITHSAIIKSINSKSVTVIDANGDGQPYSGQSRVYTRNWSFSNSWKVSISRAANSVDGWPALNASNVASTGKIKLSWYKKANAAKYFVYRASSKNGTYKLIKKTTSTTYTDTAASASYNYYYKVKAVSSAGKFMAWSDVVNRTCDLARPTILSATKVASSSKIKITWSDVKNANRYEVYRGIGDGNYTKIATFDTKMNTGKSHYCINSKNMTPGTKYYYKIKAINTNSNGADSALSLAVSCTAGSASTGNTGNNSGNSSANTNGDFAPAKTITYSKTGNQAADIIGIAKTQIGYTDNGVKTAYGDWYGTQTEWCAIFVCWCADKAGIPTGIIPKTTLADRSWWQANNQYQKAEAWGGNYTPKQGDLIFFDWDYEDYTKHVGLVEKVSGGYVYTVEGNSGDQVRTKKYSLTDKCILGYGSPKYNNDWASLTATNVENSGKIKLNWEKKSGAAKYFIYRSPASKDSYTLIKKTTITTYIDTTASASYMYKYKVKAVSSAGKFMAWSDEVKRTCKLAQPSITYIGNVASTGKIKLKWKDVKNANRYEIYRGIGDGVYTKIATFDTKMNTGKTYACINTKNVTPGVQYYYKVKAINTNNIGADSALSKSWSRVADLAQPTITSVTKGSKKITVKWTAVDNADKYQVYRKVKGGSYKLIYTTTGTTCENVKNLTKNKTYFYKVRALDNENANATSAFSSVVSKLYK